MGKEVTPNLSAISTDIVNKIIDDLVARSGIGDEWEQIDWDVQGEIEERWMEIAEEILSAHFGTNDESVVKAHYEPDVY